MGGGRRGRYPEFRLIHKHRATCAQCTREFNLEISLVNGVRNKVSRIAAPTGLLTRILTNLTGAGGSRELRGDRAHGTSPEHRLE